MEQYFVSALYAELVDLVVTGNTLSAVSLDTAVYLSSYIATTTYVPPLS